MFLLQEDGAVCQKVCFAGWLEKVLLGRWWVVGVLGPKTLGGCSVSLKPRPYPTSQGGHTQGCHRTPAALGSFSRRLICPQPSVDQVMKSESLILISPRTEFQWE